MTSSLKRKPARAPSAQWKGWLKIDSAMDFENGVERLPSLDMPTAATVTTPTATADQPRAAAAAMASPSSFTHLNLALSHTHGRTSEVDNEDECSATLKKTGARADQESERQQHDRPGSRSSVQCTPVPPADDSPTGHVTPRSSLLCTEPGDDSDTALEHTCTAAALPSTRDACAGTLPTVELLRDMHPNSESYDYIYKIILIGNPSVGKTNLFTRFTENKFRPNSCSTIGVDFATCFLRIDNCRTVKAQIWDTAGMELNRNISSVFYRSAVGVIVVYDVTDENSFVSLDYWYQELDKLCNEDAVRMLIGNKIDLETERTVSTFRGRSHAEERNMQFMETSALASKNVDKAFLELFALCDAGLLAARAKSDSEYMNFERPMPPGGGFYLRDDKSSPPETPRKRHRRCCKSS
ncbi:ras-related protein Rab-11B-like [Sycon ciliatum]|uniref:ras-related protein Rab-11B-like n=1 Tax=Sycon ciliatum TaxID=27933 RepID=UPI0031F65114